MQNINSNVYPKGGYVYKDADNVVHTGASWPGVIAKVRLYRERRGQPAGDVAAQVINQACQANPGLCRQETAEYRAQLNKTTLKTKTLRWLTDLRTRATTEPLAFVTDEERKQRAGICAACPLNQSLPEGCGSCVKALHELRKGSIGDRFVDGRLHSCGVLGEDLSAAVHLDQVRFNHSELPANCWRKVTLG
jgi:hypothetical protein